MTFVLNQAGDKGEEPVQQAGGGAKCVIDAGEENKIVSLFLVWSYCQSLPPFSALRTAGFSNGSLGKRSSGSVGKKPSSNLGNRPSAPFRSNVYQPTEMAVVLNGGTVSIKM